ncbi:hypothetical protein BLOT_011371 [Blomia tropicalis]|nr:hypothetical protein BLOT_011371 [Blomia tropicalis]
MIVRRHFIFSKTFIQLILTTTSTLLSKDSITPLSKSKSLSKIIAKIDSPIFNSTESLNGNILIK